MSGFLNLDKVKIVPAAQVKIPRTSKNLYITGYYALNVQAPEGTSGDWHSPFHWREGIDTPEEITLAGEGLEWNTNPIFGDFDIYEGKKRLVQMNLHIDDDISEVFIANHFRAILDLLYYDLKKFGRADTLTGATYDWLDTPEQKALLLSKALLLQKIFNEKETEALFKWIEQENKYEEEYR